MPVTAFSEHFNMNKIGGGFGRPFCYLEVKEWNWKK